MQPTKTYRISNLDPNSHHAVGHYQNHVTLDFCSSPNSQWSRPSSGRILPGRRIGYPCLRQHCPEGYDSLIASSTPTYRATSQPCVADCIRPNRIGRLSSDLLSHCAEKSRGAATLRPPAGEPRPPEEDADSPRRLRDNAPPASR